MVLLHHALRNRGEGGEAIPNPYPGLRRLGAHIRRSQLSMVAAASGTGKTAFVLDWMLHINAGRPDPLHVLYHCMDTDRGSVGTRVAAAVADMPLYAAQEALLGAGDEELERRVAKATRHLSFSFNPSPTCVDLAAEAGRFAEVHGCWPDVIIVDNLLDIDMEDGEPADMAKWLKNHAGDTGAAVVLLHHVTGPHADGGDVVPLSGILGQVNKPQRLILTLCMPMTGVMRVSVVKNSNGPADKTGHQYTDILCDLERMRFAHG